MADTTENEKRKSWRGWKRIAAITSVLLVFVALDQLCFENPVVLWPCRCLAYLGLVLGLASFAYWRYLQHENVARRSRLTDESEVKASIVEAKTVEPRLRDPRRPEKFEEKKKNLDDEIDRLEKIGKENWTEYEVLSLYQMLVDFRKPSDLVSATDSVMDDLDEYASDSKYRYDREYYAKWKQRVDDAKEEIDNAKDIETDEAKDVERDDKCEKLRAILKTLHEHVADFNYKWAEGSALIRDLLVVNAMAIPVFLTLGLVPAIHPSDPGAFGVINWAHARRNRRSRRIASRSAPIRGSGSRTHRRETGDLAHRFRGSTRVCSRRASLWRHSRWVDQRGCCPRCWGDSLSLEGCRLEHYLGCCSWVLFRTCLRARTNFHRGDGLRDARWMPTSFCDLDGGSDALSCV